MHEGDRKTFGILKRKVNGAVEISGNRLGPDAVSLEITVHSHRVSSRKGDFSEKICLRAGGPFFQRNLLVLAQDVTRAHHARATGVARGEAKNFAIEIDRRARVGGPEADVSDTGDSWPDRLILAAQGRGVVQSNQRQNQDYRSAAHRITSGFRYRLGF